MRTLSEPLLLTEIVAPTPAQWNRANGFEARDSSFDLDAGVHRHPMMRWLGFVSHCYAAPGLLLEPPPLLPDDPAWDESEPPAGLTTAEPPVEGLKPVVGALGVTPPFSKCILPCHFGWSAMRSLLCCHGFRIVWIR